MRSTEWAGYKIAAWAGQGLLAVAIVVMVVQAKWVAAATLAGFLVASFLFVIFERRLPALFDLLFVGAALINACGWAWDLYSQPGPYDEIAHCYTIFAITLAAGYLLYRDLMESFSKHKLLFVLVIASLGIALGAVWETAEWTADFFLSKQIVAGLFDTETDLILDSVGAISAALLNLWGLHERVRTVAQARRRPSQASLTPASKRS